MIQPAVVNEKELVGPLDLSDEEWREYSFVVEGDVRTYRITSPKQLFYRTGGTTHRVVDDDGVTHCVPTVGVQGCVLRWKASPPVRF